MARGDRHREGQGDTRTHRQRQKWRHYSTGLATTAQGATTAGARTATSAASHAPEGAPVLATTGTAQRGGSKET